MAAPNQPLATHAVDPLDARVLYDAVFGYVSNALVRLGCPEADRDDVAQRVVLRAYRRRHQYEHTRGTPGQWLWAITRNELRRSEGQRRRGLLDVLALACDMRSDAQTPEESVVLKDLAARVWKDVPEAEQRVLWDRVVGKSTFEKIAELQGISTSKAHRLYVSGMKRLRAAFARYEERGLCGIAVPFVFADLFDMSHGPHASPEALERGWQGMLVELGRREPASDDDDDDAPPRSRPRVLRLVLGPIAGVAAGLLFAGSILPRVDHDRGRDERRAAAPAVLPATFLRSSVVDDADPSPATYLANVANSAGPSLTLNADGAGGETAPADHGSAPGSDARLPDEWSLIKQGRAALASKDVAAAVAAFDQHARRFPDGRLAAVREGLRAQACARLRAAAYGDADRIDTRCAAKR